MQELKLIKKADTSYLDKYDRYESVMGNDTFIVDWMIGNTCNYACSYCDEYFHDGSVKWPDPDKVERFAKRLTDHVKQFQPTKKVLWNILGGEPTVWKEFNEVFRRIKNYDPNCIVRMLTNGSRTLRYWEKNADLFEDVIISYHPESADYKHCTEVANILARAGSVVAIQTAVYPPLMDKCIEAAKYFWTYSLAVNHSAKALQETLGSAETFVYDKEKWAEIKKYDGPTKASKDRLNNKLNEHFENRKKFTRRAYGHMMRFVNSDTGKVHFFQDPNECMANGFNTWKGWKCNIGVEALVVNLDGSVTSGNSCFQNLCHGFINDPDNIKFPTEGLICPETWCSCISDTEVTKYKVK